jgi:hypothetical protein
MEPRTTTAEDDRRSTGHNAVTGMWTTKHLEEAVELLRSELVAVPGMIESQEDLLSRGRINGIGPRVMKRAAAKLGVGFERHVYPDTGFVRTYWKLPRSSHRRKATKVDPGSEPRRFPDKIGVVAESVVRRQKGGTASE